MTALEIESEELTSQFQQGAGPQLRVVEWRAALAADPGVYGDLAHFQVAVGGDIPPRALPRTRPALQLHQLFAADQFPRQLHGGLDIAKNLDLPERDQSSALHEWH